MNASDENTNYPELVGRAQLGSREDMARLSRLVQDRVRAYIYRITLNKDLTEDLLQETLLEMVKSLKNLENAERFWPWLFRTAMGKALHHFRKQRHRKMVQMAMFDKERLKQVAQKDYGDGLKSLVREELAETVFEAMKKLKLRHRSVLALRCFEQMSYAEIAELMGCSELHSRVLFFRARRLLKQQLSRHGLSTGLLLTGLSLFGKITASAEASSGAATVTASAMKVGLAATVFGAASTKVGLVATTAVTAMALTVGGITAVSNNKPEPIYQPGIEIRSSAGAFEYPYQLVKAYDFNGSGWVGKDTGGYWPMPVVPVQCLVGEPPSELSAVSLPVYHWVELKFRGNIVDGPGDDIFIVERGARGEQALVYLTNGAGAVYLLGLATVPDSYGLVPTEIGFDVSGVSPPFVPCAVRIVGVDNKGDIPGFDLNSVRARTDYEEKK